MTAEMLTGVTLAKGSHRTREDGMCAMEAIAWLNGEPQSDAPASAARPLARFTTATNDWMTDAERNEYLKPLLLRYIGTSGSAENDKKAALMFADWAVREIAPLALDARKQPELAAQLRAIPEIVDKATVAYAVADAAAAAAYAAYAADDAADYAARKDLCERRVAILDRVLKGAYGK